jgi:hypothetical protein
LDQVPTLVHEVDIYKTIHPLQGQHIPVCLGLLALDEPYYLPTPDELIYFLLLSYAGISLSRRSKLLPPADEVILSAEMALVKLYEFNLTYRNFCVENLLWSTELHRVMIVDFGESALSEILNVSPSVRHHLFSGQKENQRVEQMDIELSSSAEVRKRRKTRHRCGKSKLLMAERKCELAAVKMEVLRWLPAPSDKVVPW